jgi:hypothetical protein
MPMQWIVIPNWDKFQHYKDRTPPWIKLYTELNSSDAWLSLTDAERGLLVTIWVEYARSRGDLKASRVPAARAQKNRRRGFERLNDAGFIQLSASRPLAPKRKELREEESTADLQISESVNGDVDEAALQLAHQWLEQHAMPA